MELTKRDRLLLINQYKILAALNKDEADQFEELISILQNGYTIFYSQLDEWVFDDMPFEDGRFVLEVLDLYRAIEDVKRSTRDERLLAHHYSFFRGFDGNNETSHMNLCRFLVETQGKFQEQKQYLLKNDNLNSHEPMIEKYERMLVVAQRLTNIWKMRPDDALSVLDA